MKSSQSSLSLGGEQEFWGLSTEVMPIQKKKTAYRADPVSYRILTEAWVNTGIIKFTLKSTFTLFTQNLIWVELISSFKNDSRLSYPARRWEPNYNLLSEIALNFISWILLLCSRVWFGVKLWFAYCMRHSLHWVHEFIYYLQSRGIAQIHT